MDAVACDRCRELEAEVVNLRQQLADRKLIERAKGLLMQVHGCTEAAAFKALQKFASRRNTSVAAIARTVVDGGILLTTAPRSE